MKKRLYLSFLCALAATLSVVSFCSCKINGGTQDNECVHSWGDYTITASAGCETPGERQRVCLKCGEEQKETTPALGHDLKIDKEVKPSCVKEGLSEGKHCARCGKIIEKQQIIPAVGHEYSDFIIEKQPSCTQDGLKYRKCRVCGDKTEITVMEPVGHSYSDYIYNDDATCIADGTKSARCTVCGKTDTVTAQSTALGHDTATDAGYAPTCVDNGLTDGAHCRRCGEILCEGKPIPALGHDRIALNAKQPTCTENGLTEGEKCARCNKTLVQQRTVPALGHDKAELAAVAPTCTINGLTKGEKCNRCMQILTEQKVLPALGHNYKETMVPFTCTDDGYTLHRCLRCTAEYKSDVVAAHHVWNMENATCGADKTCTVCGKVGEKATGRHLFKDGICSVCSYKCGHDYNIEYKEATCTEKGYKTETCKICGVTRKTETSDALGHDGNVVCTRCKTRIIPENFFVDALLSSLGGDYNVQIQGKLSDDEKSPGIILRMWRYDNGNEFIELSLTVPHDSFSETAVINVKNESGRIYASCKATVVTHSVKTEEGQSITVKNEQYKAISSVEEIVNYSVIPQQIRPIVKKLLDFGSDERAFIVALARKYPARVEKAGEYLANNMSFVSYVDGVSIEMNEKADAFRQKVFAFTIEEFYNDIFGAGEFALTIETLKKSDDQTDIRYLSFLEKNRGKTVCEAANAFFGGVISSKRIEDKLSHFLGYENGARSVINADYVDGSLVRVLFSAQMAQGREGSVRFLSDAGDEKKITLSTASDEIKTRELSSAEQKALFRNHTLSYNAEQSRFELNSTFNIVSRIVVDEKTGKSYVISLEKYVSAFTVDAVPAVEAWKKDCSGYEAHIYAFDFYGTESVSAAAYELKDNKIGAKIKLSSDRQALILAALSDYTATEPYEKQISLRREVRLMKNVDTGVFTIIPEWEEVDSATHHNYILNKDKSTVGDGCGTAAADVFVCSVCGDEYTVYKTIAHNRNYNLSYEFTGNKNDCESGVTIKYSCPDCNAEVKSVRTTSHVPLLKYESFSVYGLCDKHSVESLSCPCGKQSYLSPKDKKGNNYEQPECKYIKTEKSGSLFVRVSAFKCPDCGMLAEIRDVVSGKTDMPLSRTITIGKGRLSRVDLVFDRTFRSVKTDFQSDSK